MLSLEQVSNHQSKVWISRYALYTNPHNKKHMAVEINAANLITMNTIRGHIWLEEPHRYSYKLTVGLYQLSGYPMDDADPNAAENN